MSESVILCEGYHDRAFWAGWLMHLGCTDPGERSDGTGRVRVRDPWNALVAGGQFAFYSPKGRFLRVVPCGGKDNIRRTAALRLKARQNKELARLVLCVDADRAADAPEPESQPWNRSALAAWLKQFGAVEENENGDLLLDGSTIVSAVCWEAGDPPTVSLPAQQCLERLVCAALVAAYPQRGPAVSIWLDSRPEAPVAGPKEFAWSHMAGWYAEYGSERSSASCGSTTAR